MSPKEQEHDREPGGPGPESGSGAGPEAPPPPGFGPGQLYRWAWFFYMMLAVTAVLWIGVRGDGAIPLSLFVDPATWWVDVGVGLAGAAILIGGWGVMARFSPAARKLESQLAELLGEVEASELLALAVLSGFAEELFFRGAVQQAWGWLVASALFAVLHTGPGRAFRMWTLFAAGAGLLLGALMLWRGTLLAPVVAHVAVNAINLRRLSASRRVHL